MRTRAGTLGGGIMQTMVHAGWRTPTSPFCQCCTDSCHDKLIFFLLGRFGIAAADVDGVIYTFGGCSNEEEKNVYHNDFHKLTGECQAEKVSECTVRREKWRSPTVRSDVEERFAEERPA